MSARTTVNIFEPDGNASGTSPLAHVFDTPIRNDLIFFIYPNLSTNKQQPHATSPHSRVRPSAVS
jgi:ribosomal protein L4